MYILSSNSPKRFICNHKQSLRKIQVLLY